MSQFILFLILISLIYFLSRNFSKNFFAFWFLLTRNRFWSVWLTAVFFLPGTVVHELSHWLTAEILRVPTGEFDYLPKFEEEVGLKMASVKIGKTDFFRRTLIGIAPFFCGIILIYFLSGMVKFEAGLENWAINLGMGILIFSISLSMFSSKKDLEEAFPFFAIILILVFSDWLFEFGFLGKIISQSESFVDKINKGLILAVFLNLVFLVFLTLGKFLLEKILKRRVVNE